MSSNINEGSTTALTETTTTIEPTTTINSESSATTTTNPPSTTTTEDLTTTITSTTIDASTTSTEAPTTTTVAVTETTTGASATTTADNVATSSTVAEVTVTSSNSQVVTYTSTSYSGSTTATPISDAPPRDPSSTNTGAIAGGVVGGVVFLVILAALIFLFKRRRDKKRKNGMAYEEDDGIGAPPTVFNNDYNTYGSHTVVSDNNSLPSSRPMSMNTNVPGALAAGVIPRPFVQAYDPTQDEQKSQYSGYDSSNVQGNKFNDYQFAYNNNPTYPQDNYYATQYDPMMYSNNLNEYERNVPNENDAPGRRVSRHVPNEKTT